MILAAAARWPSPAVAAVVLHKYNCIYIHTSFFYDGMVVLLIPLLLPSIFCQQSFY